MKKQKESTDTLPAFFTTHLPLASCDHDSQGRRFRVKTKKLSPELQQAFVELLDDTSPLVRGELLQEFQRRGAPAARFLEQVAGGSNRILACCARWFLSELKFSDPVSEFRGFIRSMNYELETGVLLLSRVVRPSLDAGECCEQLDAIAGDCGSLMLEPASAREKCRVINRILFHEYGFRLGGDEKSSPKDCFIDQVLVRRRGSSESLCILYLLVARRLRLDLEPVLLGRDFLLGCYSDEEPFFIDVAEQGTFKSVADLNNILRGQGISPKASDLAPTPVREVLSKCCRTLTEYYRRAGNHEYAQLYSGFADDLDAAYPGYLA